MAERTGLEPATPGVTGRYSNQLNYRSEQFGPPNLAARDDTSNKHVTHNCILNDRHTWL